MDQDKREKPERMMLLHLPIYEGDEIIINQALLPRIEDAIQDKISEVAHAGLFQLSGNINDSLEYPRGEGAKAGYQSVLIPLMIINRLLRWHSKAE